MPKLKVSQTMFKALRDEICESKEELHDWIKTYLDIDFPDYIVDLDSNSSPMDMIWWIYEKAIFDKTPEAKKAIFIANRDGFKTLGMSVSEFLMLHHATRDVAHIGAIEAQAKRCYNYFTKYFRKNGNFGDILTKDPVMEKTALKNGTTLEILPCTLASVNGPHVPVTVLDEVDTIKDMMAYNDISGIPCKARDGSAQLELEISTRKTAYGLVSQNVENAHKTNTHVFSWNIIDLTKKCPDSRSGTKKIYIYTNLDTLEAISEEEWLKKPNVERQKFEKLQGLEGCISNCKMFAACRGTLKNQQSTSNLLHDIDYTQDKIISNSVDWVNAQLLCRKPSIEGLIYSRFKYSDHVVSYNKMWEIFTGEEPDHEISLDELCDRFKKAGIYPIMGVDFGDLLAVLLLIFIDGKDFVYIVREKTFTGTDDAELAEWAKNNWLKHGPDMVYADPADPSGIRLLQKAGFNCHEKIIKDVWGGINTVRSFLRKPGTNRPWLAIHESCENTIYEMPRYHKKKQKSTNMLIDEPEKKEDHSMDSLRYPLHTIFGQSRANLGYAKSKTDSVEEIPFVPNKSIRSPEAAEVANLLGINKFQDNRDDFIRDEKTGKMRRKKPHEYDDGDGGNFSF